MSTTTHIVSESGRQRTDQKCPADEARDDVKHLPTTLLAVQSAQEITKYYQRQEYDPAPCFELLRRALAEQSSEALAFIFQQYQRQILSWVYHHRNFAQTGESADFFASTAFESFYFALRGPRFNGFSTVQAVLGYLKKCVHTAIVKHSRDQWAGRTIALDDQAHIGLSPDLTARVEGHELWAYIANLLPDQHDQLLVHCVLGQGLKPRDVSALYGDHWSSQRDVSVDLFRIRRKLRADPVLSARVC